ncbi:hypothetical protein, partial [Erythrobacter donghaensis]|uniref:hypothetical protein n=1 Tax=Erythrobacter donghaensis TaxID=267135 RepID=UPI001E2C89AD
AGAGAGAGWAASFFSPQIAFLIDVKIPIIASLVPPFLAASTEARPAMFPPRDADATLVPQGCDKQECD